VIPNLISLSRLLLAAAFVHYADDPVIAVAILSVGGISDWLDGWVAKKLSQQTPFGALLDPACDRIFIVTVLVSLWVVHDIPLWQLPVLLARDLANSVGAVVLWVVRPAAFWSLRARTSGKLVTSLQTWSVVHIVLELPFFEVSLAAVAVATVWALADYSTRFRRLLGTSKSVSTP
jgi:phosphatidylglycerophosphate synthase